MGGGGWRWGWGVIGNDITEFCGLGSFLIYNWYLMNILGNRMLTLTWICFLNGWGWGGQMTKSFYFCLHLFIGGVIGGGWWKGFRSHHSYNRIQNNFCVIWCSQICLPGCQWHEICIKNITTTTERGGGREGGREIEIKRERERERDSHQRFAMVNVFGLLLNLLMCTSL